MQMSRRYKISLATISDKIGPVSSRSPPYKLSHTEPEVDASFTFGSETVATHTFSTAPPLDVILVPGGYGNWVLAEANNTWVEDFIVRRFDQADYVVSVCSGAMHLARSGLLNGLRATTNKRLWQSIVEHGSTYKGENIEWVPSARWVENEKVWTASGVAAGLDMAYALVKKMYGVDAVRPAINGMEYAPHTDAHWDPFSVVHDVSSVVFHVGITVVLIHH